MLPLCPHPLTPQILHPDHTLGTKICSHFPFGYLKHTRQWDPSFVQTPPNYRGSVPGWNGEGGPSMWGHGREGCLHVLAFCYLQNQLVKWDANIPRER